MIKRNISEAGAVVELRLGRSTSRQVPGMVEVIKKTLEEANLSGKYITYLGEQVRGSDFAPALKVCSVDENTCCVKLVVQPTDKESRHEALLHIPGKHRGNPKAFFEKLEVASVSLFGKRSQEADEQSAAPLDGEAMSGGEAPRVDGEDFQKQESPKPPVSLEERSRRRPSAASLFKEDHELLKLTLTNLEFGENGVKIGEAVKAISTLGLAAAPSSVLDFLVDGEYLSIERLSPKKGIVKITEKGVEIMGIQREEESPMPSLSEQLADLIGKATKHEKLKMDLRQLEEEELRLNEQLSQIQERITVVRQLGSQAKEEIASLVFDSVEYERCRDLLKTQ